MPNFPLLKWKKMTLKWKKKKKVLKKNNPPKLTKNKNLNSNHQLLNKKPKEEGELIKL